MKDTNKDNNNISVHSANLHSRQSVIVLYCPFPVSSRVYNAAMTDSAAQSRLPRDTTSEKIGQERVPHLLYDARETSDPPLEGFLCR